MGRVCRITVEGPDIQPGDRASCSIVRRRQIVAFTSAWLDGMSATPEHGEMDPLSDALRAARLDGAAGRAARAARVSEAEHMISFHILVEGQYWGGLNGEAQVCLQPRDVIVFPMAIPMTGRAPTATSKPTASGRNQGLGPRSCVSS